MKANYFNKVINILKELKTKYPSYEVGRHISSATSDYKDIWDLSDKELYFALQKYELKELVNDPMREDVSKILEEGMDLDHILDEDEEF